MIYFCGHKIMEKMKKVLIAFAFGYDGFLQ